MKGDAKKAGTDEFVIIGWNQGCSIALGYKSYPRLGKGMVGIPDEWRVGTVSLPPDSDTEVRTSSYDPSKGYWDPSRWDHTVGKLKDARYDQPGYPEEIRAAEVTERPDIAASILSTGSLKVSQVVDWPDARFRFARVIYNPLGSCALLVYRDEKRPQQSYDFKLVRLSDVSVRRDRAKAHAVNGLLLYKNQSDIYAALEELAIAEAMAPRYSLALYYHAQLLALHGDFEESLKRLRKVFSEEPSYRKKAKKAIEFEAMRKDPRFKALVKGRPEPRPDDMWIHRSKTRMDAY